MKSGACPICCNDTQLAEIKHGEKNTPEICWENKRHMEQIDCEAMVF